MIYMHFYLYICIFIHITQSLDALGNIRRKTKDIQSPLLRQEDFNDNLRDGLNQIDGIGFIKNETISGIYPLLVNYYLPNIHSNVSNKCRIDLLKIEAAFKNPQTLLKKNRWALKLIDSWGKSEDGILVGNRKLLGFFEECLRVSVGNKHGNAVGRYCLMDYKINVEDDKLGMPEILFPLLNGLAYSHYSTCIPSSCSSEELLESVGQALEKNGIQLLEAQCQSTADEPSYDASDIFGIVFFSSIFLLLLVASVVDVLTSYLKRHDLKEGPAQYLLAFSVPYNMRKIFHIEQNTSRSIITCAHGIRFLSIVWVVMGHQYYYSLYISTNLYDVKPISDAFLLQLITNGDKAVDTFFFLSGLLVAFGFFRTMKPSKRFPCAQYYIHRLVRLTPPMAICVAFVATLSRFFVDGPFAYLYEQYLVKGCRKSWWLDWTYLSNFFYRFSATVFHRENEGLPCVPQCWYVSADMQLYIVMPAILLPVLYWKRKGLAWLGFWTAMSVIIPATIIGISGTYPTSLLSTNSEKSLQYSQLIYMMPYCRASPYLVGIWAGYILWKTKDKTVILKPYQVVLGWSLSTVAALAVIFSVYPYNRVDVPNPADNIGLVFSIFYGGLHRGVWGVSIAWVLLACHWGYGGMVNNFLSHPSFQPLSKLTFCIYLTSLPLQHMLFYSTIRTTYYSNSTKIEETCGVLFRTGILALLLSLISEVPVLNIEKILRSKGKETKQKAKEMKSVP